MYNNNVDFLKFIGKNLNNHPHVLKDITKYINSFVFNDVQDGAISETSPKTEKVIEKSINSNVNKDINKNIVNNIVKDIANKPENLWAKKLFPMSEKSTKDDSDSVNENSVSEESVEEQKLEYYLNIYEGDVRRPVFIEGDKYYFSSISENAKEKFSKLKEFCEMNYGAISEEHFGLLETVQNRLCPPVKTELSLNMLRDLKAIIKKPNGEVNFDEQFDCFQDKKSKDFFFIDENKTAIFINKDNVIV